MDVIDAQWLLWPKYALSTLDNHCTRTAQSLRIGCSRPGHKLGVFGFYEQVLDNY